MLRRPGPVALRLFAFLLAASQTAPHIAAQGTSNERFEVASVKRDTTSFIVGIAVQAGGRVICSRLALRSLVHAAYRYDWAQIENRGEAWIERGEGWTIEAKVPADSGITNLRYGNYDIDDPRIRQMLQALLVERFQLKVSRETRMGDVYELTRTGRPLTLPVWDEKEKDGDVYAGFIGWGYVSGRWGIHRASMEQLAKFVSDILQTPVVDMTHLKGLYEYRQTVPDPEHYTGPAWRDSFLRMLQEVGLELKKTRGPIEFLIIEGAQRPSPHRTVVKNALGV